MSHLYELSEEYRKILCELEYNEDADEEAIKARLAELESEIGDKLENISRFIKNQEAWAEGIEKEIKRLQKKQKTAKSRIAWMKDYMLGEMEVAGKKDHFSNTFKITVRSAPVSCEIVSEDEVPEEFRKEEKVIKINKRDAIAAFKEKGMVIPGFRFIDDKRYVVID